MMESNNNQISTGYGKQETVASLLSEFQSGDIQAYSRLYDLYINVLYNYGCRLTTDKELLKDCIHDVFVKIYTKKNELCAINNFKSYLLISLKNKLCDEIRKRTYLFDVAVEEIDPSSSDDVENKYLCQEKEQFEMTKVEHYLKQLSPRQCEALTLYYLEEKKYEDICEIMKMNYQSVRNLMHRSLIKLRSLVG